jgi:hypothetical protein
VTENKNVEVIVTKGVERDTAPVKKEEWFRWATISTFAASLGYGACYVTGLVFHQTYLERFQVPIGLFKQSATDYLFFSYQASLEIMPDALDTLLGDFRPLTFIFLYLAILAGVAKVANNFSKRKRTTKFQEKLRGNGKLKAWAEVLLYPTLGTAIFAFVPVLVMLAIFIPAGVGQYAGMKAAKRDAEQFQSHCKESKSKVVCMDFMQDDKKLATGYVLQVSDKSVAFVTNEGTQIFPLKDGVLLQHCSE